MLTDITVVATVIARKDTLRVDSNSHYDKLDGYTSSVEILAAIEMVAGMQFNERASWYESSSGDTPERIWNIPTPDEEAQVTALAWQLADTDEDTLRWGCMTVRRPGVAN